MSANTLPDWPVEDIPDDAVLYMRAHKTYFTRGELQPGVFTVKTEKNKKPTAEDGLSMNWQKYCLTAADARKKTNSPEANAIISFIVKQIRSAPLKPAITVVHDPVRKPPKPDRSHTIVKGFESNTANRAEMMSLFKLEINLSEHP